MTISFDKTQVASGDDVTATVEVRNAGAEPITYLDPGCPGMPMKISATISLPSGSTGKSWPALEGEFKSYALANALGPGMVPAMRSTVVAFGAPCLGGPSELTLEPGSAVGGTVKWAAQVAPGIGIAPGSVEVRALFQHDPLPQGPEATAPPGSKFWIPPSRILKFHETTRDASIEVVVGGAAPPLSADEAIDSALSDAAFDVWLNEAKPDTWGPINVWLDADGWHVELFRTVNGGRSFGRVTLGPLTGTVRSADICEAPCSR